MAGDLLFSDATTPSERRAAWLFISAQLGLLLLLGSLPPDDAWALPSWMDAAGAVARWAGIVAVVVGLAGLGRSISPFPVPNGMAELRTRGPYAVVRHPVYAGLILLAVVWAATSGNPVTVAVAVVFVALMAWKSRWEEQRLLAFFPGYAAYAARVGRLVPFVGRLDGPRPGQDVADRG